MPKFGFALLWFYYLEKNSYAVSWGMFRKRHGQTQHDVNIPRKIKIYIENKPSFPGSSYYNHTTRGHSAKVKL